jgi:hypothetical protein
MTLSWKELVCHGLLVEIGEAGFLVGSGDPVPDSILGPICTITFSYTCLVLFIVFISKNISKYIIREFIIGLPYFITFHWGIYFQSTFIEHPCECK